MQRLVLNTHPYDSTQPREKIAFERQDEFIIVGDDLVADSLCHQFRKRGLIVADFSWHETPVSRPNASALVMVAPDDHNPIAMRALEWMQIISTSIKASGKLNRSLLAGITRLGGDFGIRNISSTIESAALAGLVKTASHEWPGVHCRVLDTAPSPTADDLQTIVDELFFQIPLELGISNGMVCEPRLERRRANFGAPLELRPGDLVVVTGGARGVTADAVFVLANEYRPTIMLLGRTPLPTAEPDWLSSLSKEADIKKALLEHAGLRLSPRQLTDAYQKVLADREIVNNLKRIRSIGSEVIYEAVDIRDQIAVAQCVAKARLVYGPVRGIIHGAGVLADKRIEDKSRKQFEAVYRTKVDGLNALLKALGNDVPKFVGLFSSTTARFGRVGQCDYAAANEVLNATARRLFHQWPNCRVVAFNWGPWDGGMVSSGLRTMFESEGVGLIPLKLGGQFFVDELVNQDRCADVIVMGPQPETVTFTMDIPSRLQDHRLNGRPVLPIAIALEAFARTASNLAADGSLPTLTDIRVLQPMIIDTGLPAQLVVRRKNEQLEMTQKGGARLHYRCRYTTAPHLVESSFDPGKLRPFPLTVPEAYEQVLFHGPAFHCLDSIDGFSNDHIRVHCRSADSATWIGISPIFTQVTQPLVIDAALQAIILWTWAARNELSLPMSIGAYHQFVSLFPRGTYSIDVTINMSTTSMIRANAAIVDSQRKLIAKLDDCEFIVSSQLPIAFGKSPTPAETKR